MSYTVNIASPLYLHGRGLAKYACILESIPDNIRLVERRAELCMGPVPSSFPSLSPTSIVKPGAARYSGSASGETRNHVIDESLF